MWSAPVTLLKLSSKRRFSRATLPRPMSLWNFSCSFVSTIVTFSYKDRRVANSQFFFSNKQKRPKIMNTNIATGNNFLPMIRFISFNWVSLYFIQYKPIIEFQLLTWRVLLSSLQLLMILLLINNLNTCNWSSNAQCTEHVSWNSFNIGCPAWFFKTSQYGVYSSPSRIWLEAIAVPMSLFSAKGHLTTPCFLDWHPE